MKNIKIKILDKKLNYIKFGLLFSIKVVLEL